MIQLPDFDSPWDYVNGFHLTCDARQMGRITSHFELYKMCRDVPGAIVECGVFKGVSFARFATFREMFGDTQSKELIGFDTFGEFPEPEYEPDKEYRDDFVDEAGEESISTDQLSEVLGFKNMAENYRLVQGDITSTVPEYVDEHPELRISLLNVDVDIYGPTKTILEHLYPRVVPGGIVLLDDYGKFPGETKAVDEYFDGTNMEIKKLDHSIEPPYVIKKRG